MQKGHFAPTRVLFPKIDEAKLFAAYLQVRERIDQESNLYIAEYPLSGFPRVFAEEEEKLLSSSQKRHNALRRERSRQSGDHLSNMGSEATSSSGPPLPSNTTSSTGTRHTRSETSDDISDKGFTVAAIEMEANSLSIDAEKELPLSKSDSLGLQSEPDVPPPPMPEKRKSLTVKYELQAPNANQLSIKAGEVLRLLRKGENGWWLCENPSTGASGWTPAAYLEPNE